MIAHDKRNLRWPDPSLDSRQLNFERLRSLIVLVTVTVIGLAAVVYVLIEVTKLRISQDLGRQLSIFLISRRPNDPYLRDDH